MPRRHPRVIVPITQLSLAEMNLGLVFSIWGKIPNRLRFSPDDQSDIIGAGLLGLVEAVNKFSPRSGVKFSSFAFKVVRGFMLDEIKRLAKHTGGEPVTDDLVSEECEPGEMLFLSNFDLTIREIDIIRLTIIEGSTLKKAGLLLGLSPAQVCVIRKGAMRKIRHTGKFPQNRGRDRA